MIPISTLLDAESTFQDDQIVSVAGVVQSVKMKTTRNNSMMAYVTLEDDTASIEMLAFSNVLKESGNYLGENQPVVVVGRLSLRDDKEPQIVINRARPMSDYANQTGVDITQDTPVRRVGTLYLRLPTENSPLFGKIRAILGMFPGESQVVVYFADTKQRKGTHSALDQRMLKELENVLGEGNVVLK